MLTVQGLEVQLRKSASELRSQQDLIGLSIVLVVLVNLLILTIDPFDLLLSEGCHEIILLTTTSH